MRWLTGEYFNTITQTCKGSWNTYHGCQHLLFHWFLPQRVVNKKTQKEHRQQHHHQGNEHTSCEPQPQEAGSPLPDAQKAPVENWSVPSELTDWNRETCLVQEVEILPRWRLLTLQKHDYYKFIIQLRTACFKLIINIKGWCIIKTKSKTLKVHSFMHYYPSRRLAYRPRAATKLLHPCRSLASLWMLPQLWFTFFSSTSTVLCQVVFSWK